MVMEEEVIWSLEERRGRLQKCIAIEEVKLEKILAFFKEFVIIEENARYLDGKDRQLYSLRGFGGFTFVAIICRYGSSGFDIHCNPTNSLWFSVLKISTKMNDYNASGCTIIGNGFFLPDVLYVIENAQDIKSEKNEKGVKMKNFIREQLEDPEMPELIWKAHRLGIMRLDG